MKEESYEKHLHKNRHREMFSTRKYVIFSMFRTIPWNSNSFQVIVKFLLLFFPLFYILNIVRGDANFPNCKFKRDCIKFANTANSQTHHT